MFRSKSQRRTFLDGCTYAVLFGMVPLALDAGGWMLGGLALAWAIGITIRLVRQQQTYTD